MTTNVTVKTVDWPVKVKQIDVYGERISGEVAVVPPQSERTFYVTDNRSLVISELPAPAAEQPQ